MVGVETSSEEVQCVCLEENLDTDQVSADINCNTECGDHQCGGYHHQTVFYSFYCLNQQDKSLMGLLHNQEGYQSLIQGEI